MFLTYSEGILLQQQTYHSLSHLHGELNPDSVTLPYPVSLDLYYVPPQSGVHRLQTISQRLGSTEMQE